MHVPRSGADPDQDACIRSCGQCDARASFRTHLTGSRHRLRYCRHRCGRSNQPDSRAPACGSAREVRRHRTSRRAEDGTVTQPIDEPPPLREIIRRYGLSARKSLGQNFLLDLNLAARIARAAGPLDTITVLEIGPGPGGLTRALLALGAARVIAVERDDRAIGALQEIATHYPGRLEIVAADALRFDAPAYLASGPARIVANLPYNIATALLVMWVTVEPWPPWFDAAVLMFQREVAERIVADVGSNSYGRLSVLVQWRCEPRIIFDVNASAFVPPPKVTSSVVRLVP